MMTIAANDVRKGETYHEIGMSPNVDKAGTRRIRSNGFLVNDKSVCTDPSNIHLHTNKGDWCIPRLIEFEVR